MLFQCAGSEVMEQALGDVKLFCLKFKPLKCIRVLYPNTWQRLFINAGRQVEIRRVSLINYGPAYGKHEHSWFAWDI